jgi:hypothetical protein
MKRLHIYMNTLLVGILLTTVPAKAATETTTGEAGSTQAEPEINLDAMGLREALIAFTGKINDAQTNGGQQAGYYVVDETAAIDDMVQLYHCGETSEYPASLFENGSAILVRFAWNEAAGDAYGANCIFKYTTGSHEKMNGLCEHWDGLGVESEFISVHVDFDLQGEQETEDTITAPLSTTNVTDVIKYTSGSYPLWDIAYYGDWSAYGHNYEPDCAGQSTLSGD